MLQFLVFVLFLTTSALGASTSGKCGYFSVQEDIRCVEELTAFSANNILVFTKNPKNIQKFQESCNSIQRCYETLMCKNGEAVQQITRNVKAYCDSMLYFSTTFSGCMHKLDNTNSPCWNYYGPFGNDFCTIAFGRNNCMKTEILNNCGQQDWIGYRDNMLNLMTVVSPDCNYDQYRNL